MPVYPRVCNCVLLPNNEVRFNTSQNIPSKARTEPKRDVVVSALDPWYSAWLAAKGRFIAALEGADYGGKEAPASSPLDSTREFQDSKKPGWGALPPKWREFTAPAKRSISLRGASLDRHFPKEHQIFLTGTLPGSTPQALQAMAEWSGYVMNRVQTWLYDNYSIDGELFHLGVWELQKRGALHYHALVVVPPHLADIDAIEQAFRVFWHRLLCQVSDLAGVDLFERSLVARQRGGPSTWRDRIDKVQIAVQKVVKSIGQYLAKYLGKGSGSAREGVFCPSRWWACTRAVKDLVQLYTEVVPLPPASEAEAESLRADFAEMAQAFEAPFVCGLTNSYSGVALGQLAIFDDRPKALGFFAAAVDFLKSALAANAADAEMLARARWSIDAQRVRDRQEAEYDSDCESILSGICRPKAL